MLIRTLINTIFNLINTNDTDIIILQVFTEGEVGRYGKVFRWKAIPGSEFVLLCGVKLEPVDFLWETRILEKLEILEGLNLNSG